MGLLPLSPALVKELAGVLEVLDSRLLLVVDPVAPVVERGETIFILERKLSPLIDDILITPCLPF